MKKSLLLGILFVVGALVWVVCSKPSSVDNEPVDSIPPRAITDLQVVNTTTNSITLQWTAPGNDDTIGFAAEYDLRVSYSSINEANFPQAYQLTGDLHPNYGGTIQQHVVDLLEPDSAYYFAIKAKDDADNWSGISNCAQGHCPAIETVIIADSALAYVIRQYIHKPDGDILSSDVDTITQVDAVDRGISSLIGLDYFSSLRILMLPGNEIISITPLTGLRQLGSVDLTNNHISDLTPLAGHDGISMLHIGGNPISDISPLSTIEALQQLWIYGTQVTDFSPLYGLTHLDDIHFANCNLTDIGFMSQLTHVRIAQLSGNHFTSIEPLAGDTALIAIGLDNSEISDLTPLIPLVNLVGLSIQSNNVSDIQPLVYNSGIDSGDVIYLNDNPLSQISIDSLIPVLEARGVTVYR